VYWEQNNKFRHRNAREVKRLLKEVFDDMHEIYPSLVRVFDENLTLVQQCVWVGMNVPWPVDPDDHIKRVVDNIMEVYNDTVYANLRCEIVNLEYEARSKL
jgi:ribosomal protein S17E